MRMQGIILSFRKVTHFPKGLKIAKKLSLQAIFLIFVVFAVFVINGWCNDMSQAQTLFYQGNANYADEQFDQAITNYEKALALEYESAALYYNLGNAYFKQGSLGKAIANYLRAQRIMPDDADVKSNLHYAQSFIKGGIITSEGTWFTRMLTGLADSFSLDGITVLSMILYWMLSIIIILFILLRNAKKICIYAGIPILILLIVCIVLFSVQFRTTVIQKQAVVITEAADAKFEPFDDATTFFVLYEGENIVALQSKDAWIKVKRLDGKQGWLKVSAIEFI